MVREVWRTIPGYEKYQASSGKWVSVHVHVAVCLAFKGPRPTPKHEVAHRDGNRTNNRPRNLRWATHTENGADTRRHGRTRPGSKNPSAKLTEEQVLEIRRLRNEGWTLVALGTKFGVHFTTIHLISTGEKWGWLKAPKPKTVVRGQHAE